VTPTSPDSRATVHKSELLTILQLPAPFLAPVLPVMQAPSCTANAASAVQG
jgi:hypothetical protein